MSSPFQTSENPYESPMNAPLEGSGQLTKERVSDRILQLMAATRPWVRLMGVMLFITTGLMVLAAMFIMAGGIGVGPSAAIAVVYLVMSVLFYLIPGVYLFRYASRISDLLFSPRIGELEDALEAQKTFWKYLGILLLIVLGIYAVMLVLALLFGAAAMFQRP